MSPTSVAWMPDIEWSAALEPIGPPANPWARLLGSIRIAGVMHHVEAIQVKWVKDGHDVSEDEEGGEQVPLLPESDVNWQAIREADPDCAREQTVEYDGRRYAFLITPAEE